MADGGTGAAGSRSQVDVSSSDRPAVSRPILAIPDAQPAAVARIRVGYCSETQASITGQAARVPPAIAMAPATSNAALVPSATTNAPRAADPSESKISGRRPKRSIAPIAASDAG